MFAPARGTILGGEEIVFTGDLLDETRDRSLEESALPAGWSAFGAGLVTPTRVGLELDTGTTAGVVAGIESGDTYLHADLSVAAQVVHPMGATASSVDLAVLEVQSGSGDAARVGLRRGFGADPSLTVGFGEVVPASGPTVPGGVVAAASGVLRLVRNGGRVWGFVGDTRVLDAPFAATAGAVRLWAGNGSLATRVRSRLVDYRVRSHARIEGRLVEEKLDLSRHRMVGRVPAVPAEELGEADVVVFGLAGETVFAGGFEYVLPVGKTVGRAPARTLVVVQDPVLRDGL